MRNRIEIQGDVTVIYLQHTNGEQKYTLIDTADLPKAQAFPNNWYASKRNDDGTWYVLGKISQNGKRKTIMLHRWLTDAPEELMVDHKDHDGLNNRRVTNLRVVTNAENQQNPKGAHGKTKCRGVYHKGNGYKVEITVHKKRIYLGYYQNLDEASLVAAEARHRLMPYTQEDRLLEQESASEALWQKIREQYLSEVQIAG